MAARGVASYPQAMSRQRVLLVDDSLEILSFYGEVLEQEGFAVQKASSGEEALELAHDWRPALVLTDLVMPGMGGLELITRLRSDLAPPVPRIVAISGFAQAAEEARRRGAELFLAKPVELGDLVACVRHLISGSPVELQEVEEHTAARRRAAIQLAEEALHSSELDEAALGRLRDTLGWLGAYLHGASCALIMVRARQLLVLESNSEHLPPGTDLGGLERLLADVIESGSTLIHGPFASSPLRTLPGARFLFAAPLRDRVQTVGVLLAVDVQPQERSAVDIRALELIAETISTKLRSTRAAIQVDGIGIFDAGLFRRLATLEHDRLRAARRPIGLLLVETRRTILDGRGAAFLAEFSTDRPLLGYRNGGRQVVALVSNQERFELKKTIERLAGAINELWGVKAGAVLLFDGLIPEEKRLMISLAEEALREAQSRGEGLLLWLDEVPRLEALAEA